MSKTVVSKKMQAKMARDFKAGTPINKIMEKYRIGRLRVRKLLYEYAQEKKDKEIEKLLQTNASIDRKSYRPIGAAEMLYDTYLALGYSPHDAIQAINEIYEKHENKRIKR